MSAVETSDSLNRPVFTSPREEINSGRASIPQLYEWHALHNTDFPVFRFHDDEDVRTLTYGEIIHGIRRVAKAVRTFANAGERQVFAILASSDTITYSLTVLGILRAGHTAFPISPRNGAASVADLLSQTGCTHILVSSDAHTSAVVQDAIRIVEGVTLHPMFVFSYCLPSDSQGPIDSDGLPNEFKAEDHAVILHSSGSTNHPKPIYWSHKGLISWSTAVWYGDIDVAGTVVGIHAIPMFHAFGTASFIIAASSGWILSAFPPTVPPTVPNAENVFQGASRTGSDFIMTIPLFIEQWSRDPEKVQYMIRMKGLVFGGAPLNKEIGDVLASRGVALLTAYGCTELGSISKALPANPGMDWEYFQITPWLPHVQVDAGDGLFEVVATSTPDHPLTVVNTKVDGVDAYATNDLLEPHPTKSGLWRVHGRRDDQIILSNGEKTNPLPLENIICEDPHVHGCLMFGQGRFQNGLLIQPMSEFAFDPANEKALEHFRNLVWASIERANDFAPQHSRIFKEMIIVTSPSKPFTYNIKGYPRRVSILQDYRDEIDALYTVVEQTSQSDVSPPSTWDNAGILGFVRRVIADIIKIPIPDDADFFRHGCDSLQATWVRNIIMRAVREYSPQAAKRLPMNIVFQAPSISTLSEAVLASLSKTSDSNSSFTTSEADLIGLAESYSSDFPSRPSSQRVRHSSKHIILITGTTGGFGCDVLERLLHDDGVEIVYAFNRMDSNAEERQSSRFHDRGHDDTLLELPKFKMVEARLDSKDFGIEPGLLDEIVNSVTHIIHNAWQVNFNLSLSSFEVDLRGLRNLIEVSLRSPYTAPPKIMFVSSIGVVGGYRASSKVTEAPVEASVALGSGYSESKWVAERVLQNVSERVHVPTLVVRLGQVCGDRLGHWNEREWFPAVVKSALFTRCLPNLEGAASLIPSYPAAQSFTEMRNTDAPILHLVHPRPVQWHDLMVPIAAELDVPIVAYADWLKWLEGGAGDRAEDEVETLRANPALRLLDFFRAPRSAREHGGVELSTDIAENVSQTLRHLQELGLNDVRRWITGWRASGFLSR